MKKIKKVFVSKIGGYIEFNDIEDAEQYVLNIYSINSNNRDCSQDEEYYELCCELIDIELEDNTFIEYKEFL
jgi:hypothetical protein